jgi:hypothetical protein
MIIVSVVCELYKCFMECGIILSPFVRKLPPFDVLVLVLFFQDHSIRNFHNVLVHR